MNLYFAREKWVRQSNSHLFHPLPIPTGAHGGGMSSGIQGLFTFPPARID